MRDAMRKVLKGEPSQVAERMEHLGLAHDVLSPYQHQGERAGKLENDDKAPWLRGLAKRPVPAGYGDFFRRWFHSLNKDGTQFLLVKADSRLLVGHGEASPVESGLTFHHTWGAPVIPGSALKGLLSHYLSLSYGPENWDTSPYDPDHPEKDRAPFQGVAWDGASVKHGPGDVIRKVFGAPNEGGRSFPVEGRPAQQGEVIFHDALLYPGFAAVFEEGGIASHAERPLALDILTPHQAGSADSYYRSMGEAWPNDWEEPNPVSFLSVRPGVCFLVCFTAPDDFVEFVKYGLLDALSERGIGAKTAAGYGRMSLDEGGHESLVKRLEEIREAEILATRSPLEQKRYHWEKLDEKGWLEKVDELRSTFMDWEELALLVEMLSEQSIVERWQKGKTKDKGLSSSYKAERLKDLGFALLEWKMVLSSELSREENAPSLESLREQDVWAERFGEKRQQAEDEAKQIQLGFDPRFQQKLESYRKGKEIDKETLRSVLEEALKPEEGWPSKALQQLQKDTKAALGNKSKWLKKIKKHMEAVKKAEGKKK
jgi:CRISPR-associated protein Cmr6